MMRICPQPSTLLPAVLGTACSGLMHSLVATTTPRIVAEFSTPHLYGWVNGAYFIASTLCLVITAPMADSWGASRTYLRGMLVYIVGTATAGLAPSMPLFLLGRTIQGTGAGTIVPATLLLVGELDEAVRARAFAILGMVQVVALLAGPILGSYAATGPGWRAGMLLLLPFASLAIIVGTLLIPRRQRRESVRTLLSLPTLLPRLPLATALRWFFLAAAAGALMAAVVTYLPWLLTAFHHVDTAMTAKLMLPCFVGAAFGSFAGGRLAQSHRGLPFCFSLVLAGIAAMIPASIAALSVGAAVICLGCAATFPIVMSAVQALSPVDQVATTSSWIQVGRHAGAALLVPLLGTFSGFSTTTSSLVMAVIAMSITVAALALARSSS